MEKASRHKEFKIENSYCIAGGETPTYKEIKEEEAISLEHANEIVEHFLDNTKMDFQCIYNGCENRAMVMSLMLKDKNIAHRKIWNFDPSKIALYHKQNQLRLKDPLGLIKEVSWDFHVAIIVLVKSETDSKAEKYVIDPAFTHSPLKVFDWLTQSNSLDSHFTYLDPEWYDLASLKSDTTIACSTDSKIILPDCFPEIYTGDFYKYSSENIPTIADELAADKQITDFTHNVINKMDEEDPERKK